MEQASLTIALDAMGGDKAPDIVIEGAAIAASQDPSLRFRIFGDDAKIAPLMAKHDDLRDVSEFIHTPDSISSDMKPATALRQGKQSSMRLAIESVKDGSADAIISAGNTGALMGIAKFVLRTLPGIDRPAITNVLPTVDGGQFILLDLGANLECTPRNLLEFAMMGDAYCRAVLGKESPSIGLLNIGSEDMKGHDYLREASELIKESELSDQFVGFVEADHLADQPVDILVTDGFTGNNVLKAIEGAARMFLLALKESFTKSLIDKLRGYLARPALHHMAERYNPSLYNGGMFLGLNGLTIKSHGGADAVGFANAVHVAAEAVRNRLNERILEEISTIPTAPELASAQEAHA